MSNPKIEIPIAARLDALRRDVTVSFGQLAAQIKTDLSELRARIDALEKGLRELDDATHGGRAPGEEAHKLNG